MLTGRQQKPRFSGLVISLICPLYIYIYIYTYIYIYINIYTHILASVKSVWDQINKKRICKEAQNYIQRAKNSLRALAVSLIDVDNYQGFKDKRKLELIKNLRKELVISILDKGNGIVLIGTNDYYTTVENLFSDKSKFKEIYDDPTPARLSSIKRYLRKKFNNRNELNDEVFKKI